MIKVRDTWFRITVILVCLIIVISINLIFHPVTVQNIFRTLVSACSAVLICEGSRYIIYSSRQWPAVRAKPGRRTALVLTAGILYIAMVLAGSGIIRSAIVSGKVDPSVKIDTYLTVNSTKIAIGVWAYSFLNAIINFPLLLIIYDIFYRNARLRYAEEENEILEKEKLRAELNQLKGVVNPHFLFNNLNSLSALIAEDPPRAEEFLDELTKVFRYLLKNNQTELTTLEQELQFIQSYYHMLSTRYGSSICMSVDVHDHYTQLLLPPLTLQLLVENVVKHNKLQKDQPVQIELLTTANNKLIVRNNIRKKEIASESTGIGLHSINARYKMLNRQGLDIQQDDIHFSVVIPLVEVDKA